MATQERWEMIERWFSDIFPTEYADSDGDGIRIIMEPADETGQVCWVVRNSRYVNPCREFPTPEAAYAAHRAASAPQSEAQPAPTSRLVERVALAIGGDGDNPVNWTPEARAAIREVAAWLREAHGWEQGAQGLERETER